MHWIPFLDELWDRGLLSVKVDLKKEKDRVWGGVCLNPGSDTVRWSESAVQRIAALLTLWWYFYINELDKVGSFIKAIGGARANEKFPNAKKLADALRGCLKTIVLRNEEEDVEGDELAKRIEKRLRDLIVLARNKSAKASADETDEGEDPEGETEAPPAAEDAAAGEPPARTEEERQDL